MRLCIVTMLGGSEFGMTGLQLAEEDPEKLEAAKAEDTDAVEPLFAAQVVHQQQQVSQFSSTYHVKRREIV